MKKTFFLFIILCIAFFLSAENFRGEVVDTLQINAGAESSFTLEKFLCIEKNTSALESFEIKIELPPSIRRLRDSFQLEILGGFNQEIKTGSQLYTGEIVFRKILPSRTYYYINVPMKEISDSIPTGIDIDVIPYASSQTPLPWLVRIRPIMKGISDNIYFDEIFLSIEAVQLEDGFLDINFNFDDPEAAFNDESFYLHIDNELYLPPYKNIEMHSGNHEIIVELNGYETYIESFYIESGVTNNLNIEMLSSETIVSFDLPPIVDLLIDGKSFDTNFNNQITLIPGEHIITFNIEDYTFSKKVLLESGKSYKISLFMDILFEEN